MKYRVGIIDDDAAKITQLLTYLRMGWFDENNNLIKDQYKDVELEPVEIKLESALQDTIEQICSLNIEALIIDYKLSSQQNISYTGITLAEKIQVRLFEFPIFILTSYQDDLFLKECFDVYQVFDFERYINDIDERLEINSKIVEQIKKYKSSISRWKLELLELLPKIGTSNTIDEKIIELDTKIEKTLNGESALSEKLKKELNINHLQTLIEKIDEFIK